MSQPSSVRPSDTDREHAAGELREHFAAGRLTGDELSERLDRVYAARSVGELDDVRRDLPRLPVSRAQRRAEIAERRAELRDQLVQQAGGGLAPFAICTVVWLASGASGSFWPAWALLAVIIPLVRNGWALYGPSPELDRVEADLARRRERERRGHHRHH